MSMTYEFDLAGKRQTAEVKQETSAGVLVEVDYDYVRRYSRGIDHNGWSLGSEAKRFTGRKTILRKWHKHNVQRLK
jgi:hypothetical protein